MKAGEFAVSLTNYRRRRSTVVQVGQTTMGGDFPVRIQSMTNTSTCDITASVQQCIQLSDAGAEYVRFTVPSHADVRCLKEIRKKLRDQGYKVPLIADVHFNPGIAHETASFVEKVRINPGNYGKGLAGRENETTSLTDAKDPSGIDRSGFDMATSGPGVDGLRQVHTEFRQLLEACRISKTALRIGVNHGSLSSRIMAKYGDSPKGMATSAMELLRICKEEKFDQVVVSMKSSNPSVMVHSTRLVVHMMNEEDMHFPVHLGVTEAGEGEDGRIRSAAGIAALLADGIGDTIRVSLTEDPVAEIPVARQLVAHFQDVSQHTPLPELSEFQSGSYTYQRRISHPAAFVGGTNVPVVIASIGSIDRFEDFAWSSIGWHYDGKNKGWRFDDMSADLVFAPGLAEMPAIPDSRGFIVPYERWKHDAFQNVYPLIDARQYLKEKGMKNMLHFIELSSVAELTDSFMNRLNADNSAVMVYASSNMNLTGEMRAVFSKLHQHHCVVPVVIRRACHSEGREEFMIKSAADLGGTLLDGLGDGIWIVHENENMILTTVTTAFRILQSCRLRISQTEYISCPSCGRTHFDLMSTVAKIREKTRHLKGLKIAIMGCIVNGPGEMADADYGYVGSGKGRITLYKSKEVIRRGIPEENAVEALLNLIRDSGDWKDVK